MEKIKFFIELASQDLQPALIIYATEQEKENARSLASQKQVQCEELTSENLSQWLAFAEKVRNQNLTPVDSPKKFFTLKNTVFKSFDEKRQDAILITFSPIYRFDLSSP